VCFKVFSAPDPVTAVRIEFEGDEKLSALVHMKLRSDLPPHSSILDQIPANNFLLLDEAHELFGLKQFWKDFKSRPPFVIAAATMRFSDEAESPTGFRTFGFDDLKPSDTEASDYCDRLTNSVSGIYNRVVDDNARSIKNGVLSQAGGHIGTILLSLNALNCYVRGVPTASPIQLTRYLYSKEFCHKFPRIWVDRNLERYLTGDDRARLLDFIVDPTTVDRDDCLRDLLKRLSNAHLAR
jgi:hypothetical protein